MAGVKPLPFIIDNMDIDNNMPKFLMDLVKGGTESFVGGFAGNLGSYILNNKQWNKANEYNDPLALRDRLTAAGLSSPAALQAVSGQNMQVSPATASSGKGLSDYVELESLKLAREKTMAEIENIQSQTSKNKAETSRFEAITPIEVQKMSQDIKESISREHLNGANERLAMLSSDRIEKMTPLELQELQENLKKIRSEVLLNHESARHMNRLASYVSFQSENMSLQSELLRHTNKLALALGVDPKSPWFMQIVQNLRGGDVSAIDAILDGMFKTIGKVVTKTTDALQLW